MRRTALQGGKLDCPCFYAVIFRDFAREEPCGAGKLLMPECVDIVDVVAELADVSAVRDLYPLRYGNDDRARFL